MLLGSEIGAALTALEPLGIDLIGLNCATGPAEMSEHLRYLSQHARIALSVMPNAGLPELGRRRRALPADARRSWPTRTSTFVREYGLSPGRRLLRHHARSTCGRSSSGCGGRPLAARDPRPEPGVASLYQPRAVPAGHHRTCRSASAPTPTAPRRSARRCSAGDWDDCVEIARDQTRDGAHLLDLCVDYVGRDGAADMRELAGRLATASTLPIMLDSTEPAVIEAGLEMLGGRASSTRSTSRTATARTPASPGSCRW